MKYAPIPLPPACLCGMPGSLTDSRAHRRWHRKWVRNETRHDPSVEELARAWVETQI